MRDGFFHIGSAAYLAGVLLLGAVIGPRAAVAQSDPGMLTFEGLHRMDVHSVSARAFGGVSVGVRGDAALMFVNPSAMHGLQGLTVSFGGYRLSGDRSQVQQFAPVRYYPNLSLLLEDLTDAIPDPDPDLIGFTPADSVQRPLDDIGPDWSQSTSRTLPLEATVAVPLTLGSVDLVAGAGFVQFANLDHIWQNNNILDPGVLEQRPLPILRPTDDDPVIADWYQAVREREGSIRGYGGSVAAHFDGPGLTIGASGLLLGGATDDFHRRVNRGELTFFANEFRADTLLGGLQSIGTSDFSGAQFTVSATLHGENVSLGVAVDLPSTITREWSMNVEGDTSGVPISTTMSGEDEFDLPLRGSIGLMLRPRDRLNIGLEYELRPYDEAVFRSGGSETRPWTTARLFRVGTSYELASWLTLSGGIRGEAETFVPDGSAFVDDPVTYRVYSAGLGVHWMGVRWDVAYEYSDMVYQDIWGSAISDNSDVRHTVLTSISYTIPVP